MKCPYFICDESPTTTGKANFYLKPLLDSGRALSKSHYYYYQVQGQLVILNLPFCDFVCWAPNRMLLERIEQDDIFCEAMLSTLEIFVVLPRVLTGQLQGPSKSQPQLYHNKPTRFCYCHREEFGKMVACDNRLGCVGLTAALQGEWFCTECKLRLRK